MPTKALIAACPPTTQKPAAEIAATDAGFLKDLGLIEALSTNRGNGIASMARRIHDTARAIETQAEPVR